jgi:hypothetical protein
MPIYQSQKSENPWGDSLYHLLCAFVWTWLVENPINVFGFITGINLYNAYHGLRGNEFKHRHVGYAPGYFGVETIHVPSNRITRHADSCSLVSGSAYCNCPGLQLMRDHARDWENRQVLPVSNLQNAEQTDPTRSIESWKNTVSQLRGPDSEEQALKKLNEDIDTFLKRIYLVATAKQNSGSVVRSQTKEWVNDAFEKQIAYNNYENRLFLCP